MKKKQKKIKIRGKNTAWKNRGTEKLLKEATQQLSLAQYDAATITCRKILATDPKHIEALQLTGTLFLLRKSPEKALPILKKALSIDPEQPAIHCNLGLAYKSLSDPTSAEKYFRKALDINPDFFEALTNLASLKIDRFLYTEADILLKRASDIAPHDLGLIFLLAHVAGKLGDLNRAISYYKKYLSLDRQAPTSTAVIRNQTQDFAPALPTRHIHIKAKLADLYERTNQRSDARETAFNVLRHDPQNMMANLVIAKLDRQRGRFEKALERLDQFVSHSEGGDVLAEIMTERGIILDRMEHFDEAFSSFSQANGIMGQSTLAKIVNNSALSLFISRNKAFYQQKQDFSAYTSEEKSPSPLFLVGFTRSGTTLLEQIIASQTGMTTSDELPVLDEITRNIASLLGKDITLPEDIHQLSYKDIQKIRSFYWQKVKESLGYDINENLFLDKQPLNLLHVDFIHKIFPSSQIIVMLRDPRDVCLSNFFQMFVLNEAMIHFLDLAHTVQFYAEMMDLWLLYKKNIPMNFHEIRYEDLVDDPGKTIACLKAFILSGQGLERGDSTIYSHANLTEKRVITTPSYHDVTQPIYTRAVNRWKNYRKQLEPYLGQLEKFITTFGYEK